MIAPVFFIPLTNVISYPVKRKREDLMILKED